MIVRSFIEYGAEAAAAYRSVLGFIIAVQRSEAHERQTDKVRQLVRQKAENQHHAPWKRPEAACLKPPWRLRKR